MCEEKALQSWTRNTLLLMHKNINKNNAHRPWLQRIIIIKVHCLNQAQGPMRRQSSNFFYQQGSCRIRRVFKFSCSLSWSKYIFLGRPRAFLPQIFPQIARCCNCCDLIMCPKIEISAFSLFLREICFD